MRREGKNVTLIQGLETVQYNRKTIKTLGQKEYVDTFLEDSMLQIIKRKLILLANANEQLILSLHVN